MCFSVATAVGFDLGRGELLTYAPSRGRRPHGGGAHANQRRRVGACAGPRSRWRWTNRAPDADSGPDVTNDGTDACANVAYRIANYCFSNSADADVCAVGHAAAWMLFAPGPVPGSPDRDSVRVGVQRDHRLPQMQPGRQKRPDKLLGVQSGLGAC